MVLVLHRHGFLFNQTVGGKTDAAYGKFLRTQVDDLSDVVNRMTATCKKLKANTKLSQKSKGDRVREATSEAHDEVERLACLHHKELEQSFAHAECNLPTLRSVLDHNVQRAEKVINQDSCKALRDIRSTKNKTTLIARASEETGLD